MALPQKLYKDYSGRTRSAQNHYPRTWSHFLNQKKEKKRKKENKQQQQQQQNIEKSSFFISTFLYIISAAGWKMEVFRLTQPDNG